MTTWFSALGRLGESFEGLGCLGYLVGTAKPAVQPGRAQNTAYPPPRASAHTILCIKTHDDNYFIRSPSALDFVRRALNCEAAVQRSSRFVSRWPTENSLNLREAPSPSQCSLRSTHVIIVGALLSLVIQPGTNRNCHDHKKHRHHDPAGRQSRGRGRGRQSAAFRLPRHYPQICRIVPCRYFIAKPRRELLPLPMR